MVTCESLMPATLAQSAALLYCKSLGSQHKPTIAGDAGEAAVLSEAGAGVGGRDAHAVYSPAVLAASSWACGVTST